MTSEERRLEEKWAGAIGPGSLVLWHPLGVPDPSYPPCLSVVTQRNTTGGSLELSVLEPQRIGFTGKSGVRHAFLDRRGKEEDPAADGGWTTHPLDIAHRELRERVERLEQQLRELLATVGP